MWPCTSCGRLRCIVFALRGPCFPALSGISLYEKYGCCHCYWFCCCWRRWQLFWYWTSPFHKCICTFYWCRRTLYLSIGDQHRYACGHKIRLSPARPSDSSDMGSHPTTSIRLLPRVYAQPELVTRTFIKIFTVTQQTNEISASVTFTQSKWRRRWDLMLLRVNGLWHCRMVQRPWLRHSPHSNVSLHMYFRGRHI